MTTSARDSDPGPHSDPRSQERVGSVLDEKWTLERILGSGGMGAVYAARHRNGARGAVKVLHPELARRPDVRERFLREGYAANRVEHRGAVQVLDDDIIKEGPDEGTAYLVMEILEGESLEERLERGPPLTEIELLTILDDVLAVLEAAHEHGVVHRDLKPANLFLNRDPAGHGVKVLDFGLARLAEVRSGTSAGLALGTPSFMAPEQASGRQEEIDARSDIFAVGATAFMILANRGVHEAAGVIELVARMGTLPAPKLRDVAPMVSEPVARIVDRALEFKREDRYPSATEMRADVVSVLAALRSPAVTVIAPVTQVIVADSEPATSEAPASAASGRGGWRAWPVLAVLLAAGVALLVLVPRARTPGGVGAALDELMAAGARASASAGESPSAA
ncbi:MAG TPA: serine/threonine-protein kinase, partial [Labilithrix sp.]|nr:serine/threonine-protein kinase [Labilithrix sp.]